MSQQLLSVETERTVCRESPTVYLKYINNLRPEDFEVHINRIVSAALNEGNIEEALILLALYSLRFL